MRKAEDAKRRKRRKRHTRDTRERWRTSFAVAASEGRLTCSRTAVGLMQPSTPVTVTVCAVFQLDAVKISVAGLTVSTLVSLLTSVTVTSPPTG